MPVETAIFARRNVAYQHFRGTIGPVDHLDGLRRALDAPLHRTDTAQLADLSAVDHVYTDFMRTLTLVALEARLAKRVDPGTRYALFAPDDLSFGAARMFHQIAETVLPYHFDVFSRQQPALAHIRQPESTLRAFLRAAH